MAISTPVSVGTGTASGTNTGPAATSSQAVSLGDLLEVSFGSNGGETPTSCTDSLGNTYTQAETAAGSPGATTFYSVITVAGTPTVTANCASLNRGRCIQLAYMTGAAASPLNAHGNNDQAATVNETVSTTGAVTQSPNNVAIQVIDQNTSGTATSTAGYTALASTPVVSAGNSLWTFYKMDVTAAIQTATATMGTSSAPESNLCVFLGAAAASPNVLRPAVPFMSNGRI